MNRLKIELDNFWDWAGISPNDYKNRIMPIHARQAEWEDDYPKWGLILKEIDNSINDLNDTWDNNLADLLVIAISIDNENGFVFDECFHNLKDVNKLIDKCCNSDQFYARLEIAERINKINLSTFQIDLLINDKDEQIRTVSTRNKTKT